MCVRLCWLLEECVTKPVEHDLNSLPLGQIHKAMIWFYDTYDVREAEADKSTGVINVKLPIDNFSEVALTLHELWQETFLRSQHSDLKDEYQRYESLRLLIKSLTEKTIRV
jgi:hypothetical protein